MKRNLILGTVFSAALAVGASAQTPALQASQDPQQQPQQKESQQRQQVTVTGCLQSAEMAGAAGTTGTGTAGTSGQTSRSEFMLTNAKITSGAAGTTGTTGTTGTASMNKFKLTGGNQQDLKQYLNSQVEIRGTLQKSASERGSAGTGTGYGATGQKKMDEDVQTIRITSVKQTAKTCTSSDR